MRELSGLSFVVGLAAISALKEVVGNQWDFGLKWPNDLMYQGQKLGGILIEMQEGSNDTCQALIGIGINVNMLHDKVTNIEKSWTSLREVLGNYLDRNTLCVLLMRHLLKYLDLFAKDGLALFQEEWKKVDTLEGHIIEVNRGDNIVIKGVAKGISALGHLILEKDNGVTQTIASGEASILSIKEI